MINFFVTLLWIMYQIIGAMLLFHSLASHFSISSQMCLIKFKSGQNEDHLNRSTPFSFNRLVPVRTWWFESLSCSMTEGSTKNLVYPVFLFYKRYISLYPLYSLYFFIYVKLESWIQLKKCLSIETSKFNWSHFNSTFQNVGYPGSGFAYFPLGFARKGDQNRIKKDQDRTRRALSNALFTFPLMPPQTQEKSKILSKNNEKTLHI